jgi:hypothetical protein
VADHHPNPLDKLTNKSYHFDVEAGGRKKGVPQVRTITHKETAKELLRIEADSMEAADMAGANLEYADLVAVNLSRATLRGTNLCHANLSAANLSAADLRDATLEWADLAAANLEGADARDAVLLDANFRGANLRRANLSGAHLYNADLRGADLTDANLTGTYYTDGTRWPEGINLKKRRAHRVPDPALMGIRGTWRDVPLHPKPDLLAG